MTPLTGIVWSPGTLTLGGVVSETVTVNDPKPVSDKESVAWQLTSVEPSEKLEPEDGEHEIGRVPSSPSVAT